MCRNRDCCKRFFLHKFCCFGTDCKYHHNFSCDNCDNLLFLIQKENQESEKVTKYDEIIAKMTNEKSEGKREIMDLNGEQNANISELASLKKDLNKKDAMNAELKNE